MMGDLNEECICGPFQPPHNAECPFSGQQQRRATPGLPFQTFETVRIIPDIADPMPAMTLTDFLHARIAEDEAVVGDHHGDCDCSWPAFLLAECEAKRRIVKAHREWDENEWQSPAYFSAPMDLVLSLLALPYADHPDYREEWRP